MFKRYEIEKLLYVHPTFLGVWQENAFKLARHLLQGQLVGHVLKDVGMVIVITRVTLIKAANFDPVEGGIYARVRFICYAFAPALKSILKGKVTHVDSNGLTLRGFRLPSVTVPAELLRPRTVFNADNRSFVWTKIVEDKPKYFETKVGDEARYQVEEVLYSGTKEIAVYDGKSEVPAMEIVGDMRTYSLGPVSWYTAPSDNKGAIARDSGPKPLETSLASLKDDEPDYLTFLKRIRKESLAALNSQA